MRDIFRAPPTAGRTRPRRAPCTRRAAATPLAATPLAATAPRAPRTGFTLVEVLMVILIISMLIALVVPAVRAAQVAAVKASIKIDVGQLVMAMEKFKSDHGSYPPDRNWTNQEILTFLRKAFPRRPDATYQAMAGTIQNLNEAETLVLWLGGMWDTTKLTGFNADPTGNPFGPGSQRTTPIMQFPAERLLDREGNNGFPEYYPPNINLLQAVPYVCFTARNNGQYGTGGLPQFSPFGRPTAAVPYYKVATSAWVEPTKFQIISASVDNDYGAVAAKEFPRGTNYTTGDNDNIVSFTERTIGDAKP